MGTTPEGTIERRHRDRLKEDMDMLADWVDTSEAMGEDMSRADTVLGLQLIRGFIFDDLDAAGIPPPRKFPPSKL
ncbi:MAG: hypothetical protein V4449_02065 [Patescibacteria group bacterium]